MMALQIFLFFVCFYFVSLFPKSDPKEKGTVLTKLPSTIATTTVRPYPGCGVKLDFEVTGHIWEGTEVEQNSYPWMAFLYNFNRSSFGIDPMDLDLPDACKPKTTSKGPAGSQSICGGSVINPRFIMTAAHCVACRTTLDTAVVLGKDTVEINILTTTFRFLSNIHVFPKYKRGVPQELRNSPDIALLELEVALSYGPTLNAICLPSTPSSLYLDETMIVAGWGVTETLNTSEKLMEADVKVFPNVDCKEVYGYDFLKRYTYTFYTTYSYLTGLVWNWYTGFKLKICLSQFSPVYTE